MDRAHGDIDHLPADIEQAAAFQEIRAVEQRREAASRWPLLRTVNRSLARVAPPAGPKPAHEDVSGRYDLTAEEVSRDEPRGPSSPDRQRVPLGPVVARRTA